jgi:hypothetical protein
VEPLVVSPDTTDFMLDQSSAQTAEDIRERRLESFMQGRRRKVTVRSIYKLMEERLAASDPNARNEQAIRASQAALEKHRQGRGAAGAVENEAQPGQ